MFSECKNIRLKLEAMFSHGHGEASKETACRWLSRLGSIYCVWRETLPLRAKSAGLGGLLGFVIGAVYVIAIAWI